MALQHNTKDAIKTALAMTIAYGVGLQMGWDRPYWAGFAVAFISLSTVGQSLNKGTLRMVGTVVGAIVALTLIGLFAQQRWLFILFLSLWLALCTYMNAGNRHQYFWFVAGFVAVIIAADGGPSAEGAFSIAMLRMQQTGLGILVYSLIAILLWPINSRKGLEAAARSDAATRQKLFSATLQCLADVRQLDTVKALHSQEISSLAQVAQLLDAATTDSEEVRALDKQWRRYQHATLQFSQTLSQWRENFSELRSLPLQQLLPGMDAFALEVKHRLQTISGMMDGVAPSHGCADLDLAIDKSALSELSPFHRAALVVAQHQMEKLDTLSQAMFASSSAMHRYSDSPGIASATPGHSQPWVPDPDRLLAAAKIITVMWLAFLAVVYIGDFPGGMGFLAMCGPIGMILVSAPQMPVRLLFAPVATGISFAGFLYIFVMPQLSSFVGLGTMIFLATFVICYHYAKPQQAIGRALGLAMLVTLMSVSNQQTYNFLSVANTALMFPLLFLLLTGVSYLPYSPRPERALLRLLTRYFRSAEFLLSQPPGSEQSNRVSRREAFHNNEVASLPNKLNAWVAHADPKVLGAESVQQLPDLVNSLQVLSYRLQEMQVARSLSQSTLLARELKTDMLAWRERVIEIMHQLSIDPAYRKQLERGRLDKLLAGLENRIEHCFDGTAGGELSREDEQNFYRLLGAYRGTSEAMLDFAQQAAMVDWNPWYKERFA